MSLFLVNKTNFFDVLNQYISSNYQNAIDQLKSTPSGKKLFKEGKTPLEQAAKARIFVHLKDELVLVQKALDRNDTESAKTHFDSIDISISKKVTECFINLQKANPDQKEAFKSALDKSIQYLKNHWSNKLKKEFQPQVTITSLKEAPTPLDIKITQLVHSFFKSINSPETTDEDIYKSDELYNPPEDTDEDIYNS